MNAHAETVTVYTTHLSCVTDDALIKLLNSPAVKPPILSDACIGVRIKYFYSFMTFGLY